MTRDESFMRQALRLAARGRGKTSPNPMVGALVVRGKEVVGRGYHPRAGEPHAEVLALREAGEKSRGATLYVNLEPCDHYGRTPPCTEAILQSRIRRVVCGVKDPNPLVSGKGIDRLRRHGVQVEVGVLEEECRRLNAPFFHFMATGRPLLVLKGALSLDGKIATRTGDSRWVTSAISRREVHRLRASMDALMVGIGTVLKDDPLLTVRLPGKKRIHQPLRVIVDSRLRIPLHSQIVKTAGEVPTLVAATASASTRKMKRLMEMGLEVSTLPQDPEGRVDLSALMKKLGERGVLSVLLEGGTRLNGSALEAGIVDRILLFIAPKIIGGEKAPGLIGGEGIDRMKEALPVKFVRLRRLGPDILVEGEIQRKSSVDSDE
jgi:diaminohydroxyphosphoribosylaminopyrimidine deaminase/5-amino-6-(5-phosphoribosylamino)uracil reductase